MSSLEAEIAKEARGLVQQARGEDRERACEARVRGLSISDGWYANPKVVMPS